MADFSEQFFGFQDALFDNFNGCLEFLGNNCATCGLGSQASERGRDFKEERKRVGGGGVVQTDSHRDEEIELVVPLVFENCKRVLDVGEQIVARDLYWEAVCDMSKKNLLWGSRMWCWVRFI
ncbi:hypothetical protein CFP56_015992 [Quercus suber]|uniref:Uncharacterized protein n=1 Tax=Quercus suber TaxID=58331 RepID=A0AAW0KQB4_QUESU